jgi:DNA-binding NarL/FixJ family response regulator
MHCPDKRQMPERDQGADKREDTFSVKSLVRTSAEMQIILADNQSIFREGIARICDAEPSLSVIAQCADLEGLRESIGFLPNSVVIFPSSITSDLHELVDQVEMAGSRVVLILERDAVRDQTLLDRVHAVLLRSVAGPQLIDCLHRVAAGGTYLQRAVVKSMPSADHAGANAARRLTQRELQIIGLVSEGRKNRQIADHLGTKEQVVKNYLRAIYGKTGVSDRLELALFTLHHRVLAELVEQARVGLTRTA